MGSRRESEPDVIVVEQDAKLESFSGLSNNSSGSGGSLKNRNSMKPHKANNDAGWDAIRRVEESQGREIRISDFNVLQELGSGDMGTVYLAELRSTINNNNSDDEQLQFFAMKVMDKSVIAERSKESRNFTEHHILGMLDHPFLPTLYARFETPTHYHLLIDFCVGGDLYYARQKQPNRKFDDEAVRFYASEVVLALEYLHMIGVVYRDLKPENVLLREDGHVMLTDFDLALLCDTELKMVPGSEKGIPRNRIHQRFMPSPLPSLWGCTSSSSSSLSRSVKRDVISCMPWLPLAMLGRRRGHSNRVPASSSPSKKMDEDKRRGRRRRGNNRKDGPEMIAEPVEARSESFVGTHEYLAPEIVTMEGHGSAVDWWTLGIFVYELLYGVTPFKGSDAKATMENVVSRKLIFPDEEPLEDVGMILDPAPGDAKDLIRRLLEKDPSKRLGSTRGSIEIKQHPFFRGIDWTLIRCDKAPIIPKPYVVPQQESGELSTSTTASVEFDAY